MPEYYIFLSILYNLEFVSLDKTLDLKSLVLHLSPISDKFKLFGSVAGICPTSLNMIIAECTSPYNALMKVCQLWLEKCRNEEVVPTWHAVAEILDLIGETKLSTEVLEVYAKGNGIMYATAAYGVN